MKRCFKRMIGTAMKLVPSYLDEYLWSEHYGRMSMLAFINNQRNIAECYLLQ